MMRGCKLYAGMCRSILSQTYNATSSVVTMIESNPKLKNIVQVGDNRLCCPCRNRLSLTVGALIRRNSAKT